MSRIYGKSSGFKVSALNYRTSPNEIKRDIITERAKDCPEPIRRIAREADKLTKDITIDPYEIRRVYERGSKDLKTAQPYINTAIGFGQAGHSCGFW